MLKPPIPLYYSIKEDIVSKITSGVYKIDEKVPSENELQKIYSVSLITARRAISDLANEHYLYRIKGKGTYVAKPKINRELGIAGFTREME